MYGPLSLDGRGCRVRAAGHGTFRGSARAPNKKMWCDLRGTPIK